MRRFKTVFMFSTDISIDITTANVPILLNFFRDLIDLSSN